MVRWWIRRTPEGYQKAQDGAAKRRQNIDNRRNDVGLPVTFRAAWNRERCIDKNARVSSQTKRHAVAGRMAVKRPAGFDQRMDGRAVDGNQNVAVFHSGCFGEGLEIREAEILWVNAGRLLWKAPRRVYVAQSRPGKAQLHRACHEE